MIRLKLSGLKGRIEGEGREREREREREGERKGDHISHTQISTSDHLLTKTYSSFIVNIKEFES